VKGKPVVLAHICVVPGCISIAQQRHHMWPKSYLRGQPYEWVKVGERTIANSVGLCIRHHTMVTGEVGGHSGKIVYLPLQGIFEWWEQGGEEWYSLGPLKGQALVDPEPEAARVRRTEGLCPSCGRPKRPEPKFKMPPRETKNWGVLVPDDAEKGAEILDTYVEDFAVVMGLNPESKRLLRYHVLVPALEWVSQHKGEFISDWEEASA